MRIGIFYHVWAPVDSPVIRKLIDSQINKVIKSGILEKADFNCVIIGGQCKKIESYIRNKFECVKILETIEKPTAWENHTLEHLWKSCKKDEYDKVLYFHTKGLSKLLDMEAAGTRNSPQVKKCSEAWRRYMELFMIDKWKVCVQKLDTHGAVGVEKRSRVCPHYSGNFWWASKNHIKQLKRPLSVAHIKPKIPHNATARHTAEMWIGTIGSGPLCCLKNFGKNLYAHNALVLLKKQGQK